MTEETGVPADAIGDIAPQPELDAQEVAPQEPVKEAIESAKPLEEKLAEKEALISKKDNKIVELERQKEHWRNKYERDIAKSIEPEPSTPVIYEDDELAKDVAVVKQLKTDLEKEKLLVRYPALSDKREEFEEFLKDPENRKLSIERATQVFLVENGLLSTAPRLGLEKPSGGATTPSSSKYTEADVRRLRENQPRKYEALLRSGALRPEDIGE